MNSVDWLVFQNGLSEHFVGYKFSCHWNEVANESETVNLLSTKWNLNVDIFIFQSWHLPVNFGCHIKAMLPSRIEFSFCWDRKTNL